MTFAWPAVSAAGDFEIVRTSLDRVWRLDKRTGEISVCRLDQIEPVCAPAREAPGAAALVKNRQVVYVVRQPLRPVVVKPALRAHGRKWKR
jgi:hypothetical protein